MFEIERLKQASEKDLREINLLTSQLSLTGNPPKPLSLAALEKMAGSGDYYLLVTRDKDKIVGVLALYLTQIPTGLIAEAEDLVVDVSYRQWGLGAFLIKEAVGIAEKAGAKHISLRTNPSRTEANKMYDTMGFKKLETNFYRINLPRKS